MTETGKAIRNQCDSQSYGLDWYETESEKHFRLHIRNYSQLDKFRDETVFKKDRIWNMEYVPERHDLYFTYVYNKH